MSKAMTIAPSTQPRERKARKLPPMTGFLIGGGVSLMVWGVAILLIFT